MSSFNLPINVGLPYGATDLSLDELDGLIPNYISSRAELNEFEKRNIMQAIIWLNKINLKYEDILTINFCIKLHSKMFDKTWNWAGKFRQREINIGNIPPEQVTVHLKNTLDDAKYWIKNNTYPIDEACLRIHRTLAWIHPFPNGNGRHSRVICDKLRHALGLTSFTWGKSNDLLVTANKTRENYINALRAADQGNYAPLIQFAI